MQNFYIILSDENGNIDWRHPNELKGISKEEIYNLIIQDVPQQNIIEILTAEEYDNKYVKKIKNKGNNKNVQQNIAEMSSEQFETGKDFFNAMLNAGNEIGQNNNLNNLSEKECIKKNLKNTQKDKNINNEKNIENTISKEIKYFEEGGIKFKLENGILYKKVWKQILLNGQTTSDGTEAVSEYRLVSSTTKKLINVDKVELQHLEWEEVKTH